MITNKKYVLMYNTRLEERISDENLCVFEQDGGQERTASSIETSTREDGSGGIGKGRASLVMTSRGYHSI